jgi:hypothetical protein
VSKHRIAYYADIHYTSESDPGVYWAPPPNLDVEAILFAGDIHYAPHHLDVMFRAIRASQRPETLLILVPGDGDYTNQDLASARAAYRAVVEAIPNAVWLDDAVIDLPSGLRVIGSTLWTFVDHAEAEGFAVALAALGHSGVDKIRVGDRLLTFDDTTHLHLRARAFIESQLFGLPADERRRTVVCTHYWPTFRAIDEKNPNETRWRQLCASDLDAFIAEHGPGHWVAGHLHTTKDVTIGTTRLVSNPRAGEGLNAINPAFAEKAILEFVA